MHLDAADLDAADLDAVDLDAVAAGQPDLDSVSQMRAAERKIPAAAFSKSAFSKSAFSKSSSHQPKRHIQAAHRRCIQGFGIQGFAKGLHVSVQRVQQIRSVRNTAGMTAAHRAPSRLPSVGHSGAICPNEANDLVTMSFSTADIPEADRVAMWRGHHASAALDVEIEPAQDRPFEACVVSHIVPGLQLLSFTLSAARIMRTQDLVADGNDEFALFINRTGNVTVCARGRDVQLAPGDAVLISSDDVMVCDRSSYGESLSLRVPRSVLSSIVDGIDDAVMRPISGQSETLKLLTSYAATLIDGNVLATPDLRSVAVNHVHDLITLAFGATRDVTEAANRGGLRAARLREAKVYIVENSSLKDISVGGVAAHLGITPRYLQRLFEADGTTFSAFLLGQRLTRAYRMLCDPQFSDRPVGVIAYDVGFGDLSYFNRCFRRQYGVTPTGIKEAAAK